MNLIVDIGNTRTKLAVYEGQKQISFSTFSELKYDDLGNFLSNLRINRGIISSVRELPPFVTDLMCNCIPSVHTLSYTSKLPFKIEYETPETLGTDRIAAIAGAYNAFYPSDVLVIDAGTAITYDFLIGTIYTGGNISPGIDMRFRALNNFTAKLPLLSKSNDFSFPARNTSDAIIAGVITGVVYEINEYIRTFEKKHKNLKIIITGGDGSYLKDKILAETIYMPDIVIDGLNYILNYNAK